MYDILASTTAMTALNDGYNEVIISLYGALLFVIIIVAIIRNLFK